MASRSSCVPLKTGPSAYDLVEFAASEVPLSQPANGRNPAGVTERTTHAERQVFSRTPTFEA